MDTYIKNKNLNLLFGSSLDHYQPKNEKEKKDLSAWCALRLQVLLKDSSSGVRVRKRCVRFEENRQFDGLMLDGDRLSLFNEINKKITILPYLKTLPQLRSERIQVNSLVRVTLVGS